MNKKINRRSTKDLRKKLAHLLAVGQGGSAYAGHIKAELCLRTN